MSDLENLKQAEQDLKNAATTKRGRRVLLALVGVGFLAAIIVVAFIRAC